MNSPGWFWNRRYWRRRIENTANRIGMAFGLRFWKAKISSIVPDDSPPRPSTFHELETRRQSIVNFEAAAQQNLADGNNLEDGIFAIPRPPTPLARSRANSEVLSKRRPSIHGAKRGGNQKLSQYSPYLNDLLLGFSRAQDGKDLTLNFRFESLSLRLPSGKTILNGVTGHVVPGRVTVIMGPSGAGKSTLMNVLMGKLKRTGGKLLINNREVGMHNYKKVCSHSSC
jgi:ABC-type multidrug transport system fused ATPase/permease subunit